MNVLLFWEKLKTVFQKNATARHEKSPHKRIIERQIDDAEARVQSLEAEYEVSRRRREAENR